MIFRRKKNKSITIDNLGQEVIFKAGGLEFIGIISTMRFQDSTMAYGILEGPRVLELTITDKIWYEERSKIRENSSQ